MEENKMIDPHDDNAHRGTCQYDCFKYPKSFIGQLHFILVLFGNTV